MFKWAMLKPFRVSKLFLFACVAFRIQGVSLIFKPSQHSGVLTGVKSIFGVLQLGTCSGSRLKMFYCFNKVFRNNGVPRFVKMKS